MRQTERMSSGRAAAIRMATTGLAALVAFLLVVLGAVPPAAAEHNALYVVCPPPIPEGETAQMRVRWPGKKGITLWAFTTASYEEHPADRTDIVAYDGKRFRGRKTSSSVWVPVITKQDSSLEHNEEFKIGFWDDDMWHGCRITIIDDDGPKITGVDITSNPVEGNTYRFGETIDVTVDFDQNVEVEGTPRLSLFLGDGDESTWRGAEYFTGSGTRYLTFRYEVQVTDRDGDGVSISSADMDKHRNPTSGFAGTINANGTDIQVDYTHPGLDNSGGHRVDGAPYVQNVGVISVPTEPWDAYRTNDLIEIAMNFNTDIEVEGEVLIGFYVGFDRTNWGEAKRQASYLRGSGTDTLVFGYTVRPGDNDDQGIWVGFGNPQTGMSGTGTIKAKGTNVELDPYYSASSRFVDQKVDTEPPAVISVIVRSQPVDADGYEVGEFIRISVAFSEQVTTRGDLQLELDLDGATRQATLQSQINSAPPSADRSYSDMLVFEYEVLEGDTDTDGIGISPNSLKLNGGSIHDSAGNAAGLDHDTVTVDPTQKVDTTRST